MRCLRISCTHTFSPGLLKPENYCKREGPAAKIREIAPQKGGGGGDGWSRAYANNTTGVAAYRYAILAHID